MSLSRSSTPPNVNATLGQLIQTLNQNFTCLELSIEYATDLQIRSLETLGTGIDELRSTVETLSLSGQALCTMVRHDIRNQLTVIGGFAQLLQHKRVGTLEERSITFLQNILTATRTIADALESDKAQKVA